MKCLHNIDNKCLYENFQPITFVSLPVMAKCKLENSTSLTSFYVRLSMFSDCDPLLSWLKFVFYVSILFLEETK